MPQQPSRLDADQQMVCSLPLEADGVVIGSAGTGKSTALTARVVSLLETGAVTPDEVLVLTPSRGTATRLRDDLGVRVGAATPGALARSLGSLAFQIVRSASVHARRPAPQLLTGADQDRIIAELLRLDAEAEVSRWPESLPAESRGSRDFRSELRTLLSSCTELGLAAADLARLGESFGRATWVAAASFLTDYRDVLARVRPDHRDAADLVAEATALLAAAPHGRDAEALIGPAARLRTVLIDDAQELTAGHMAFLAALRSRGVSVLAFGDPDIGSGAFRGVTPEYFASLAASLGAVHVLHVDHRSSPAIARLARAATQGIGAGGRVDHRRDPGPEVHDPRVGALIAASPHEEMDAVARVLRDWHLNDGVPWGRMAVIAHDTRQIIALDDELGAREVPTRAAGVQRPLGQEPVVRALLDIVRLGITDPETWDAHDLAAALVSPFGGLDAVGLRRLRAALRRAEFRAGGTASAGELLRSAMAHPLELTLLDASEAHEAERLATTLRWLRESHERGETVHELLWMAWDRAREDGRKLAVAWRERAVTPGPGQADADRALDALVALFEAAKRAVERGTDATADAFIRVILDTDVPEDTLAAAERGETVSLLTPATALGAEFDAVVLAGVQDGVWPNVRLRGGLLDFWLLADAVAADRAGEPPSVATATDRRRAALSDELRLFVRAVSRARTHLLVTAVDDDDTGPSPLLSFLPEPHRPSGDGGDAHPLTLRGLVTAHRRTLTSPHASAARREEAAGQLRTLAEAGVAGADPDQWYGVRELTSRAPLRDATASPVPVSPSKLEGFEECALDWAVRALGGDTRTTATGLGTILHNAMEQLPTATTAELESYVDERWGELDFEAPWLAERERRWATTLVGRLHAYLSRFRADEGRNVAAEAVFRIAVPMVDDVSERDVSVADGDAYVPPLRDGIPYAELRGSIDRVEVYPPGAGENVPQDATRADASRVVVVDLKTGKSEGRFLDAHVTEDAQLLSYQLAVRAGAVPGADPRDSAGARLLVLSKDTKDSLWRIAHQGALDGDAADGFVRRIVDDARGMASDTFTANLDEHCRVATFAICTIHTIKAVSSS